MDAKSIGQAMEWFGNIKTVGVKFPNRHGEFDGKIYLYTLYQNIKVEAGDLVVVPTKDTFSIALVVVTYPGGTAIYRGIYGVINKERFAKNEEKFADKVRTLANLFECAERHVNNGNYDQWNGMFGNYLGNY